VLNATASSSRSGFEQPIVRATIAHNIIRYNKRSSVLFIGCKVKNKSSILQRIFKNIGDIDNFHYLCTCQKVNQNCFRLVVITLLAWECKQKGLTLEKAAGMGM
jgi:hypothetical protein